MTTPTPVRPPGRVRRLLRRPVAVAEAVIAGCELRVPHDGTFVLPIPNAINHLGMYLAAIEACATRFPFCYFFI